MRKVGTWGRAPAMAEFAAVTEVAESRRGTVLRLECGLRVMVGWAARAASPYRTRVASRREVAA